MSSSHVSKLGSSSSCLLVTGHAAYPLHNSNCVEILMSGRQGVGSEQAKAWQYLVMSQRFVGSNHRADANLFA